MLFNYSQGGNKFIWKLKKLDHYRLGHDGIVIMDRLHLLGGTPDSRSRITLLKNGTWTRGPNLMAPEIRGCSVAVSLFEVITVHTAAEPEFRERKVYKYNMMTGVARYYKTKHHPHIVSNFQNTCVKKIVKTSYKF